MIRPLAIVLTILFPLVPQAADRPASETAGETATEQPPLIRPAGDTGLGEFLWTNRVLVVFADSPADPRYQDQIKFLQEGEDMLRDRDVIVLTDTSPADRTPVRRKLRPRGFQLTLVDKDGVVKLRKPVPWTVREIAATIDKTPMRLMEVEERRRKAAQEAPR
ncbi:DUF4174 domain-containing protein [Jhaorihella thermophila]|uniref:DUF4174 domain-containing protein n=1 Tax=Jhaorihella thermophila TaxID=488547 RepID=A0A1H5Y436_9RHOB|nr:DUF4174 domain-containing protein [Jhaorihella thermophila]SEG18774.1 protein of unknown function [Jhaorihella thermophila]